jgi:pyridoxal phosphate enzyme (YggS family)
MDFSRIQDNILNIKERAARAAGGREVTVIAATKTVPAEAVCALPRLGIGIAGENRVQEFIDKYGAAETMNRLDGAPAPLEWHFIGRLQTNKVKYIVDKASLIHSVDRLELAAEISRVCRIKNVPNMGILIEVNAGGEESKGGLAPENATAFAREVAEKYGNLTVRGLMPVLPVRAPRALYLEMSALYGRLQRECPSARYLSMGMSGDFETAIQCGANMVRLGTAIFGARTL